jgi:hypothetical protein
MITAKTMKKQQWSQQQQQRRVSIINSAETIMVEDIVVPAMPPLRPRLPRRDTLL